MKEEKKMDAEKLLGKILKSAIQGGSSRSKGKKNKSNDLMGSLFGSLASGKGLVTAIGLGVGAYEILKNSGSNATGSHQTSLPSQSRATNPPPLPSKPSAQKVTGSPPPLPSSGDRAVEISAACNPQDIATKCIQTMVAAAHADGRLDEEEEGRILERLQEEGLSVDEKRFILGQLHSPQTIDHLIQGVNDPMVAQTMYSLAVFTIVVDTENERQWLDQLADGLSISGAIRKFLEEEV